MPRRTSLAEYNVLLSCSRRVQEVLLCICINYGKTPNQCILKRYNKEKKLRLGVVFEFRFLVICL